MAGSSVEVARLQVAVLVVLIIATASCFQAVRSQYDGGVLNAGDEVQGLRAGHGASYLHRALKSMTFEKAQISRACQNCSKSRTCCSNRYCVNLKTNEEHCGSCGNRCRWNRECCDGKCVNTESNRLNCGECGNVCPSGSRCHYGLCGYNDK